jgi:RecA/RadA recombinase
MIIELFGPPAAGKTTFARNLATHLRQSGRRVELNLSYRPAETVARVGDEPPAPLPLAAMRRLTRSTIEFLTCMRHVSVGSRHNNVAAKLLDLLPPESKLWTVRLHQYITRLESAWNLAKRSDATVIIDQGFVQAICSLLLLGGTPVDGAIENALALIPKADQLIRIDAPQALLQTRLEARRRGQGWIERCFELDMATSLRSIEILDRLDPILRLYAPRFAHIGPYESWPPRDLPLIAETSSGMTHTDAVRLVAQ